MTNALAVLLTGVLGLFSTVPTPPDCPTGKTVQNDVSYYHGSFSSGECWLSYSKAKGSSMNYRSVLFTSDGSIMVFNSFDESDGVAHGARVFTTFPRNRAPTFEPLADGMLLRTSTEGFDWIVNAQTKHVTRSSRATVTETTEVKLANHGGIEIVDHDFLILDSGWMNQADPTSVPRRMSTFIDKMGTRCDVRNFEIFEIDSEGEHHFKFTDTELSPFLAQRCPSLLL